MAKRDIEQAMKEADRLAAQPMRSTEEIAEEFTNVMNEAAALSRRKKPAKKAKK